MSFKIGNDIIETNRIQKLILKYSDKFKNKIYTDNEIKYCESKGVCKYQSYAARFAAKEACFKAISDKLEDKYEINWKDIEILNNNNGKPYIKLAKNIGIIEMDLSISHVKEYAIASVIAQVE